MEASWRPGDREKPTPKAALSPTFLVWSKVLVGALRKDPPGKRDSVVCCRTLVSNTTIKVQAEAGKLVPFGDAFY